jgi:hypothetical protein
MWCLSRARKIRTLPVAVPWVLRRQLGHAADRRRVLGRRPHVDRLLAIGVLSVSRRIFTISGFSWSEKRRAGHLHVAARTAYMILDLIKF